MSYSSLPHLRSNVASEGQTVAPVKTNGAGAGTSPTITVTGSDEAGQVSIAVGSTPAAGTLVTLTFQTAYGSVAPVVLVSPVDSATATVGGFYASATTTQVVIGTHGTPAGTLKLNYVVVGGA